MFKGSEISVYRESCGYTIWRTNATKLIKNYIHILPDVYLSKKVFDVNCSIRRHATQHFLTVYSTPVSQILDVWIPHKT